MVRPPHEDPEYQRQLRQQRLQQQQQQQNGFAGSSPIAIPGVSFTHHAAFLPTPKQNKFMRIEGGGSGLKVSPGGSLLQQSSSSHPQHSLSPKSRVGRGSRGDTRKCRKVYGMESRELWCTQCKWKKACTRFHD